MIRLGQIEQITRLVPCSSKSSQRLPVHRPSRSGRIYGLAWARPTNVRQQRWQTADLSVHLPTRPASLFPPDSEIRQSPDDTLIILAPARRGGERERDYPRQTSGAPTAQPARYGSPQVTAGADSCANGRTPQRPPPPDDIKVWAHTTWGDAAAVPSLCSTQSTLVPARK